jgi:hypothetical protein
MIVQMHFGDGTSKDINMSEDDPEEAVKAARDWVEDNAWFEATGDDDETVAEARF